MIWSPLFDLQQVSSVIVDSWDQCIVVREFIADWVTPVNCTHKAGKVNIDINWDESI